MIMVIKTLFACSRNNAFVKDIFLLFHINRRSIENSRYSKLCSSTECNTIVKKSMHHIQLEKRVRRLENILTHYRSQIKNDNPLNGPHFPGCEQWLQSETAC